MAQNIIPSAGRKYGMHISRGASGNSLFPPQKIDLTASIWVYCHKFVDYANIYIKMPLTVYDAIMS